jgi:integron integrase
MQPPKLLDQVRDRIRRKHYSLRTESAYIHWIRRFIYFHDKRHPRELGAQEVERFLTHLAVAGQVSASTQNQAMSALLFLYKEVLVQTLPWLDNIEHARRPKRLPVVLTREEVNNLLTRIEGTPGLMLRLIYGTGMRIMECLRLRVKDVDFARGEIVIREGKGAKDRVTMLPTSLVEPLTQHLARVKLLHDSDLRAGYGDVYLPFALARKYPNAGREWGWQYVFPSSKRSIRALACGAAGMRTSPTFNGRCVRPCATPGFTSPRHRIRCGIRLRHIYCRPVMTSARFRNCSVTTMFPRP